MISDAQLGVIVAIALNKLAFRLFTETTVCIAYVVSLTQVS